jgi:hypothetical protein
MCCWKNNSAPITVRTLSMSLMLILSACNHNQQEIVFYPIDSLITHQIENLSQDKAILHKEAFLKGHTDTVTYIPRDTTAWVNELDIFRQLKIMNKPVNRDSYIVDDGLYDPGSNLTVKAFTSKNEDLPVLSLRVFYDDNLLSPRRIEAVYREENTLYKSSRNLSLEFQQIDNKTVLTAYAIEGGQKMILEDSIQFAVRGKIQIN